MPVVSLWRNGFYFNFSHIKFLNRYKILSPYTWPHFNSNSVVESIAQIVRSVPLPAAEFGIGLSKVFIRSPRTLYELNEFRNLRLNSLATLIQKTFRCHSQRIHFQRMKRSQMMISSAWRTWRVSFLFITLLSYNLWYAFYARHFRSLFLHELKHFKECRYGIPFSGRKHLWGLYRVVIINYFSPFLRSVSFAWSWL